MRSPLLKQPGMNGTLLSFLLGLAGALAIFLPYLIVDKGFFLYCGDYNSQQIPFYTYVQQFIKTGGGTWSWATDLGSSVVNSYSFYNIGSPFLWLTLLFPTRWVPFLMVPLFMLKFGGIAAAAHLYLGRYAKSRNMAVICSVVYAFCGFNVYNVFFNHMLDPVVIFPLMLWALDGFMYQKRRGWFALFVGLALVNSYFFFIGNVVFILLYFLVRLATGEYRIDLKDFGLLAVEVLIGVGIGMILALPAYFNLIDNPRTDSYANGFGMLLYGHVHQYFNILTSMFLAPDPPYLPSLFTEGAIKWTSMSFFLPVVGMAGVFSYFRSRKGGSIKILLAICFVMALVPILNSSFYAFNSSYYARWYYMPLLMAAFATMRSLEDTDIDLAWGSKLVLIITAVYALFGLLPNKQDGEWVVGVESQTSIFWLNWGLAMAGAVIFYLIVVRKRRKPRFGPLLLGAVMAFSVMYSIVHLGEGKFPQWDRDQGYRAQQYDGAAELQLPEGQFYRIDAYGSVYDNIGLWLDKSCLQTFNSVVTPSIMEFYPMVGVKRDVSSKPETEHYALRGLLSVQYTLMPPEKEDDFLSAAGTDGWSFWKTEGPYTVYTNDNYVPLGFTYDQYVTMDNLQAIRTEDRAPLLMRAIGLDDEQAARYSHLFEGQAATWELTGSEEEGGRYVYDPVGYNAYVEDCNDRRLTASYYVTADASGFTSLINLERDNLVFYAVPYDPGFTATVNGMETEVLKVSGGLMAVEAPAGDNEIVFTYKTPGFSTGIVITMVSLAALLAYVLLVRLWRRGAPARQQRVAAKQAARQAIDAQVTEMEAAAAPADAPTDVPPDIPKDT
ncbi:MAG: YfhO family protein [Ruminococcaceae bacterium]|nr:YfhO family protein [Oscillospiraceae bacterium]